MMKKSDTALTRAKAELARLQEAIRRYEQHQTPEAVKSIPDWSKQHRHDSVGNCPERAAVVRASMDVTRVLAVLRRERGLW